MISLRCLTLRRACCVSWLIASAVLVAAQSAPSLAPAEQAEEEKVVELSPFVVKGDDDVGYLASSTLAGTRLRTPLSDLGAAVSVVTQEFLDDTGVTDINQLLVYMVSTEGSGLGGNFSGSEIVAAFLDENDARRRPQNATRIRGLIAADITRNFFQSDIPFDSYNVDRVDISRGANAILFGLGSPAGVIDNTLITPMLNGNATKVVARFGSHSSFRAAFDHNQVVLKDRAALRLALLHDDTKYRQKPAFQEDERIFLTARVRPFVSDSANTTLSANYERGRIEAARPLLSAPGERLRMWFVAGQPGWDASVGTNAGNPVPLFPEVVDPDGLYDIQNPLYMNPGIFWNWAIPFDANSRDPIMPGFQGRRPAAANTPGQPNPSNLEFFGPSLEDLFSTQIRRSAIPVSTFDFRRRLLTGMSDRNTTRFNATNVTLEQNILNHKMGFELSYDRQRYSDVFASPIGKTLYLDVNTKLLDGRDNPNFGRPFLVQGTGGRRGFTERDSTRATAYGVIDVRDHNAGWLGRILGRHTLTGLYSEQDTHAQDLSTTLGWVGPSAAFDLNESNITNGRRQVLYAVYIGPSLLGTDWDDVRLDFNINTRFPSDGDTHSVIHWDRASGSWQENTFTVREAILSVFRQREIIDSRAGVLQSNWLDDHVVTVFGWRKDTSKQSVTTSIPRLESGELQGSVDLNNITLTPETPVGGRIFSSSVVIKQPKNIRLPFGTRASLHYSRSENFQPIAGEVNIFGHDIDPPTGLTEEYGVSLNLLENRVFLRLNRFSTDLKFSRDGSGVNAALFNQVLNVDLLTVRFWQEGVNAGVPSVTQANVDALVASIPQSIRDLVNFRFVTLPDGTVQPEYTVPVNRMSDVTNFASTGHELELTTNVTANWRLTANVARVEAIRSETAPFIAEYVRQRIPTWTGGPLSEIPRDPAQVGSASLAHEANRLAVNRILNLQAQDGVASQNLRKWRFNLVTNYTFGKESRFKGFGAGGAYRWQDRMVIGYPQRVHPETGVLGPDLANPFTGPTETSVDLWLSYRRPILAGKANWKIQLNVRNVFADNEVIALTRNNDGTFATFRASPPRNWFVTSTFDF